MALAWEKSILVVGPRENVFHGMSHIEQVDAWGTKG